MQCCLVTSVGVQSLALVLKDTQLKELDLSHNHLRNQAVGSLRAAVQGPHPLLTLRLKDCGFSKEGGASLVSDAQKLTELDLSLN